jgi:glyoxylase-like metal-dependent hydrolase (beta-lactamase superfamily II)
MIPQQSQTTKHPRVVLSGAVSPDSVLPLEQTLNTIFAFPPNRDTLGGTAYLIVRNEGNILVDCPALDQTNQDFWRSHGGVRWLFLSHRGAIGKAVEIQQILGCKMLIQEQEAYLLPGLTVTTFNQEFMIDQKVQAIWTPGHSPGSSCLYYQELGGVLFSGRHLIPNEQGAASLYRTAKTFHWPRQIKSLTLLQKRFTAETLQYICPGANMGYLRGQRYINQAYHHLTNLELPTLTSHN